MTTHLTLPGPEPEDAVPVRIAASRSILQLLDAEIEHLRAERSRGGWTAWALVIALGTIAKMAIDIWEKGSFEPRRTALLFVLIAIIADFLVQSALDAREEAREGPGRFRVGSYLGWRPSALLIIAVRWVIVAAAAWIGRGIAPTWATIVIMVWYGAVGAMLVVLAIMTVKSYPFRHANQTAAVQMGAMVVSFAVVILIAAYMMRLGVFAPGGSLDDIRLAALLVAAVHLATFLLMDRHREPLLESLVEIRRGFVLGDLTLSECERRTRIVLSGMAAGDWIQPELRALLDSYDRQQANEQAAHDLARLSYEEIARLEELASQNGRDEQVAQAIRARVKPVEHLVEEANSAHEGVTARAASIAGRFGYLKASTPGIGEVEAEYKRAIDPMVADSIKRDVELAYGYKGFVEELTRRLAALGY